MNIDSIVEARIRRLDIIESEFIEKLIVTNLIVILLLLIGLFSIVALNNCIDGCSAMMGVK